jgi:hypothetical protein
MKPNRTLAYIVTFALLSATTACVMAPNGGGGGGDGRVEEHNDRGSRDHLNNLRDAGHWNDAGDPSEREQSSLDSEVQRLKVDLYRPAIYYPPLLGKHLSGFWV